MTARLAYDYYGYQGVYPFDYGEPAPVLWLDRAPSHTAYRRDHRCDGASRRST